MPRGIPNAARNAPAFKSTGLETSELPIGRTERAAPTQDNPVGAPKLVDVGERMFDQEKLANLAFMAEPVTIRVPTTTDKNAEQVFEININGKPFFFRRGETKTVPRYVVDHMARLKVTAYRDREVFNAEGVKQILHEPSTGIKYDFAMVNDSNPMGEHWLKATLAMGG
jgi:hypothetical protein